MALSLPTEPLQSSRGDRPGGIFRVRWAEHRAFLDANWQLGEHVSIFAPTGNGKTHLITRGLLPVWDRAADEKNAQPVMFIDCKDGDPLTRNFGTLVDKFPSKMQRWRRKPWWRLKVPSLFRGATSGQQQHVIYDALRNVYNEGNWILVIDEVRPLVELKLQKHLTEVWERGRTQGITLIAGTQAPSWMPPAMYDSPKHVYLGAVLDRRRQVRFREMGGYSEDLTTALAGINKRQFIYVGEMGKRREIVKVARLK